MKDEWQLKNDDKWSRPKKVQLYGFGKKRRYDKDIFNDQTMDLRRKQFFNFFADFFTKHKVNPNAEVSFSPEEEAYLIKKYFNRYFDGCSSSYLEDEED